MYIVMVDAYLYAVHVHVYIYNHICASVRVCISRNRISIYLCAFISMYIHISLYASIRVYISLYRFLTIDKRDQSDEFVLGCSRPIPKLAILI